MEIVKKAVEQIRMLTPFYDVATDSTTRLPIRRGSFVTGHPIIGFGSNLTKSWTYEECDMLLRSQVNRAHEALRRILGDRSLPEHKELILLLLIYYMGPSSFERKKQLHEHILKGQWEQVQKSLWEQELPTAALAFINELGG